MSFSPCASFFGRKFPCVSLSAQHSSYAAFRAHLSVRKCPRGHLSGSQVVHIYSWAHSLYSFYLLYSALLISSSLRASTILLLLLLLFLDIINLNSRSTKSKKIIFKNLQSPFSFSFKKFLYIFTSHVF